MFLRFVNLFSNTPLTASPITRVAPVKQHMQRRSHVQKAPPNVANLEVERKFNVTSMLKSQLDKHERHRKTSPLYFYHTRIPLRFYRKPDKLIKDQYFDFNHTLVGRGIWLRKRTQHTLRSDGFPVEIFPASNTEWEAKVALGGDFQNSEFEEIVGEAKVMDLIKKYVPLGSLTKTVDLSTLRKTWDVREESDHEPDPMEVSVVIDRATASAAVGLMPDHELMFEHVVGEVETTRKVDLTGLAGADLANKARISAQLNQDLKAWMVRHENLFPTHPVPIGKLTAYFAWKKQIEEHFDAWR